MKLNRPRLFSRKFENQQGVIHLLLLIILLGGIITGVYLVTSGNPLKLFSKAFDKKEARSIDVDDRDKEKKPEFAQGEVLVKLKTPLGKLKFKPNIQSLDVDKQAIPFSSMDASSLPPVLATINAKYQIKTLEKVFKGAQSPEQELAKFKTKFSQDISEGKRKINEQESLKNDLSRTHKLTFEKQDILVEEVVEELKKNPDIEYAEPNFIYYADVIPNDTDFPKLWGLQNTGQTGGVSGADIKAPQAWDITTGDSNIVVGVIDSGIDYNHPDLAANIWVNPGEIAGNGIDDDNNGYIDDVRGWDFVNNDNDPMDDDMHGTHVAGTIGAAGNNLIGVAGVSWHVKLMPLKFLNSQGRGSLSAAAGAIHYATVMGVKVTNNSWGGGGYSRTLYDVINEANSAGSLFVAAAGNSDINLDVIKDYPSSYGISNIIAVAASNSNDHLAYFSNYGVNSVHLAAPGYEIYSTTFDNSYTSLSGTSMATPYVSGVVALVLSKWPNKPAEEIKRTLLESVDKVPALTDLVLTGGRLNAYRALSGDLSIPTAPSVNRGALLFGGGRYISILDDNKVLALTDNFTIEGWFKLYGKRGMSMLVERTLPQDISYRLFTFFDFDIESVKSNKSKLAFSIRTNNGNGIVVAMSAPVIPNDTWVHIAAIRKGNTLLVFVNGEKMIEKNEPISPIRDTGTGDFHIGVLNEPTFLGSYLRGEIDDLRISNNVRDVENNWKNGVYLQPLQVDQNSLALWRFDGDLKDEGSNHLSTTATGNVDYTDGRVQSLPTPPPPSIKVNFKDTSGKPISQIACAACWNGSGGYTKIEQCQQTGTEVVITKPALCNTYNPVLGVHLAGGNRTEVTNVSANPASSFKTYMNNQYFGWSDIKTWTLGERTLTLTVKPAQMWTPSPRPTPKPSPVSSACTACSADADKSGFVNTGDFSLIKACQSKPVTGACANADVNGDKQINGEDITCWQANLGKQCSLSSPSPTPAVFTCTACAADINKDGWVNILDFSKLSGCYFKDATGDCKAADINPDGKVNAKDYACLVSQYNKKC